MSLTDQKDSRRCGFAAIIGVPNAGKSTLTNALVGSKISIVSRKVQTTRTRVMGILTRGENQIVLVDTPGVFKPKKTLEKAMVKAAWDAMPDADIVIHLVDASVKVPMRDNKMIFDRLSEKCPTFLALNKVDQVDKPDLLKITKELNERFPYTATFMISSLKEQGLDQMMGELSKHLPEGPWMFEEGQITDIPARLMAAEITREKIFERLHEELPYETMIATEEWEEFDDGSIKISQIIYVQRETQKGIVVGKGGSQIKKIGEEARRDLEDIFEKRIHLKLFVKTQENWSEKAENYRLIGLDF